MFDDTYKTLKEATEGVFRDRGSKFIGYAFPIRNENEVKTHLAALRSEHPKARHFCWAFRLGIDRNVFRLNDDGEPSGTAGRPILNCLLSNDITNVLIVVVRYFGGTLLGVPGLINAYKMASIEAINAAQIIEKTLNDQYQLNFDYLAMNDVMRIIKDEKLSIIEQTFDTNCRVLIEMRKNQVNLVIGKFEKIDKLEIKYCSSN